jgi:hypothetical protein
MPKQFKKLAQVTRMSPRDILEQANPKMVRSGYEHGMSLSAYLDRLCPREQGDESGLDAFGRVMREAGNLYPERTGIRPLRRRFRRRIR